MDSSNSPIEKVLIITADSRTLVGKLLSCDQMTNLVRPACPAALLPNPSLHTRILDTCLPA